MDFPCGDRGKLQPLVLRALHIGAIGSFNHDAGACSNGAGCGGNAGSSAAGADSTNGGTAAGTVDRPTDGWRTFFAELEYEADGQPFYLSTQLRMAEAGKK